MEGSEDIKDGVDGYWSDVSTFINLLLDNILKLGIVSDDRRGISGGLDKRDIREANYKAVSESVGYVVEKTVGISCC